MINMKEYQGIVIKNSHYKDNDGMITILTNKGLVSFLAKGIYKIKSKNARALTMYTYGNYELLDDKYGNTLKTATSIFNVFNVYNSFESLTSLSLIGEATFCGLNEYDDFNIMDILLTSIKKIEEGINPYLIASEYLLILLKMTGYGIDFNNIKNIITNTKELEKVYINELIVDNINLTNDEIKKLLEILIINFEDDFGVKLKSHEAILL